MGDLTDFSSFADQLQRELEKLEHHHPDDQPHIKRFVQKIDGNVADSTLAEYLKNLRVTSERIDGPIVGLSEADMDAHTYDLRHSPKYGANGTGMSDGTIRNVEFAVRKFLKFLEAPGTEWAENYDLTTAPQSPVTADDMLSAEDISELIKGANNMRDIAIIEFLADTAARLTLVGSLRVGDVDLDGDRAVYSPNPHAEGLKGADIRPYPVIDSKAALRSYLRSTHPRPDRSDVALFHMIPGHGNDAYSGDGAISPTTIRRQLQAAADNAGIDKPVNPHNFRHSAVTRMLREDYNRSQIEHRVHWTIDSDMWQIYEHISAEQHNEDIFAHAGVVDADEDAPDHTRHPCGNCRETLGPHHSYCPNCGNPVTRAARERLGGFKDDLFDRAVTEDDDEIVDLLRDLNSALDSDPETRKLVSEVLVE